VSDLDWYESAACAGKPTAWFFPTVEPKGARGIGMYRDARACCATCEVVVPCLRASLSEERRYARVGFRGGKSPVERDRISGTKRCPECGGEVKGRNVTCSQECYAVHRRSQQYASRRSA
jgi:hypothetical protein